MNTARPTETYTATASPTRTQTPTATAIATETATVTATETATETATASPSPSPSPTIEWATYGQNQLRTFFNDQETRINRDSVSTLRRKWRYLTGAVVTAGPTVAWVDVPGEGRVKVVFIASWDEHFYALRASNGSTLWRFKMKPHPGGSFPYAASAEVTRVAGEQRVYIAGGMTVYSLEAATGTLRWEFDAGTGCTTCDRFTERNEIECSPTVVGDLLYFAMDTNDSTGKGGAYALNAEDGRLVWYFDVVTRTTCRPLATDNVRHFDGYHTAAELRLPDDFFTTRPGCDFDRAPTQCGNIWSSFAVDTARGMIYTATSNCDTDDDPNSPQPPPPMPPYDEAFIALTFDGVPVWAWRPREVDNGDLAFGGVPNLFSVEIGGAMREVIGVGNKDGIYYLLDRDGVNELTGSIEPYWQTKTVPGGPIGGIIASAAVGRGQVFFSTAIGFTLSNPQKPAAWSLRATDGAVVWSNNSAPPSYGPTTAVPEVAFMGSLTGSLFLYDAATGATLRSFALGGPVASPATILDGEVFVGAGVGARDGDPDGAAWQSSLAPSYVTAFCLADAPDCPETLCDDGDPCTNDFYGASGCEKEPSTDGIQCKVGPQDGTCVAGTCVATPTGP